MAPGLTKTRAHYDSPKSQAPPKMNTANLADGDRTEIVFFDVETTVPTRPGMGYGLLEFGAIMVCPRQLVELESYSTLIRPDDLSRINSLSVRCNGITRDAVMSAPSFRDVADKVFDLLHGRVWAGHNILRFDCVRIKEAFEEIGRAVPEPKGTIDSLKILTEKFGRRAGNMKMATLATYFGLGEQTHRSLDDVRMNLEVVKYCATVLFLESSLPNIYPANSWVSPNAFARRHSNWNGSLNGNPSSSNRMLDSSPIPIYQDEKRREVHLCAVRSVVDEVLNQAKSKTDQHNPFDMGPLKDEVKTENLQSDTNMDEDVVQRTSEMLPETSGSAPFLDPDEVCIPSIIVTHVPFYWGIQKIRILHKDVPLQLCCSSLRVRFGISTKYFDQSGRPKLNFVVDSTPSLYRVLHACDNIVQKSSVDSGSSSEWRPLVTTKNGYFNSPTVRLHLSTTVIGANTVWDTEVYHRESTGTAKKLELDTSIASQVELGALLVPEAAVDAYLSLEHYDYKQNAGIKLVARKLIIHST